MNSQFCRYLFVVTSFSLLYNLFTFPNTDLKLLVLILQFASFQRSTIISKIISSLMTATSERSVFNNICADIFGFSPSKINFLITS
jgi:hypothetical protein